MRNGWAEVPLGEVLTHRKEFIEIDDTQEYKRCRVQLHAKGVVLRDIILGSAIKTKRQQVCCKGEFLVAEIDAKVGGFGIVPSELSDAIVSSHYFLFSMDESRLGRRFLDFYCRTPLFREQINAQGSTNYAAIRPAHVLGYTIPLPPLREQQRIVAKIEQLAKRIEEAKRLRTASAKEIRILLNSASRHALAALVNAEVVPLETVCSEIIDCLHSNPVYSETGIPTIRSPDVGWGTLMLDTARKTSEHEYTRRIHRGAPAPGDIILVREGGGTGKAGIVDEGQKLSLGQRVMQLRPRTDCVRPRFLLHQWLSPVIQQGHIAEQMKGSASPHLNIKAIRKFPFILPPLDEQDAYVRYLDTVNAKLGDLERQQQRTTAELDALLPSILDKAFKGEL